MNVATHILPSSSELKYGLPAWSVSVNSGIEPRIRSSSLAIVLSVFVASVVSTPTELFRWLDFVGGVGDRLQPVTATIANKQSAVSQLSQQTNLGDLKFVAE
ncbi:hypothetical protein [Neorhodopirellula pilleata]|uniref:hypothetical protein n=1 Tax=Neorhodopirellula pilleata TaxID=2714738 RepID=UPI001E5CAA6B|nr:hypothetical protein [Neorhodopirellula pilleata]